MSISGVFSFADKIFSAKAIPTALAKPCPKGPVVVSTPGVTFTSGWPGVFEPSFLNSFISSIDKS